MARVEMKTESPAIASDEPQPAAARRNLVEYRRRLVMARCVKAAVQNGGLGSVSGHHAALRAVGGAGFDGALDLLGARAVRAAI